MRTSATEFSSTVREIRGARKGLQALHTASPALASGNVQLWGDNLGAISACSRMGGNRHVFAEVRSLYTWAWHHDISLSFVWRPRTHPALRMADFLSKWQDPSDWRLSRQYLASQVFNITNVPDIDLFASTLAHQNCNLGFYSALWSPHCLAVDAWKQHWGAWPSHPPPPRPHQPPPSPLLPFLPNVGPAARHPKSSTR